MLQDDQARVAVDDVRGEDAPADEWLIASCAA
jgi:hypothetical protein